MLWIMSEAPHACSSRSTCAYTHDHRPRASCCSITILSPLLTAEMAAHPPPSLAELVQAGAALLRDCAAHLEGTPYAAPLCAIICMISSVHVHVLLTPLLSP